MTEKESKFLNEVAEHLEEAAEQLSKEYHGDHLLTEREKFIRAEQIVEHIHHHDITPEIAKAVQGIFIPKKPVK
jgi:hypothetical protein